MIGCKYNEESCNGLHHMQKRYSLPNKSTSYNNFAKENLGVVSDLIMQKKDSTFKYNIVTPSKQKMYSLIQWLQRNCKKTARKYNVAKQKLNPSEHHETNRDLAKKVQPQKTKCCQCSTLEEVLRKEENTQSFRTFLVKEMSEENLDFYLAVEAYKKQTAEEQPKLAEKIFNTFIAQSSLCEVNVDHHTRKQTKENLLSPDVSTFNLAQHQIYRLMETDSFRRFSEQFR